MPASYLMSWEPRSRRWWKMDHGKRFVVSVRQLRKFFNDPSIPDTKEGSYQWANRWWRNTLATLSPESPVHPHADELAGLTRRLEWAHRHDPEATASLSGHVGQVEGMGEGDEPDYDPQEAATIASNLGLATMFGIKVPDNLDPVAEQHFFGNGRVWKDRLLRDKDADPVPVERTVGALVARYLDTLLKRHETGDISVGEYSNAKAGLFHLRDWLGPESPVEGIDADKWDAYFLHLIGESGPKSVVSRRKYFRYARNLITWLDDLNIHSKPKNLDRRQYRFKGGAKSIPTMSIDNIKSTLAAANGQLKLHLLLMFNCGFTQQDISDLHPSEIDWVSGRIRRKRSKTGDQDKVPVVDYLLWHKTFALLQQYRSDDPDHVLLTESGKTWMRDVIHDGKRSRTDAIQSCYRHLDVEDKQPLKMFRKASSTIIDGSSEHGRYAVHFLGHAPDIAHRHYISSNGPGFDAALRWLGEQIGY